jgi:hypothetical protein
MPMRLAVVPPSVAFLAIIRMLDQRIVYLGTRVDTDVSFTIICECIFYPIAWLVISVVVVWPAAIVCKHARKGRAFPKHVRPEVWGLQKTNVLHGKQIRTGAVQKAASRKIGCRGLPHRKRTNLTT